MPKDDFRVTQTFHGPVGHHTSGDLHLLDGIDVENLTPARLLDGFAQVVESASDIPADRKRALLAEVNALLDDPYLGHSGRSIRSNCAAPFPAGED
jgi:hypothetical protein